MRSILKKLRPNYKRLIPALAFFLLMFAGCFYFRRDFFTSYGMMYRKKAMFYMIPAVLTLICSQIRPRIGERWYTLTRLIYVMGALVLATCAMQSLCWRAMWDTVDVGMKPQFMPIALSLTAVVFMAVWLLIWDSRWAAVATYVVLSLFGYVYNCVWLFRGAGFRLADLLTLETALAVSGNYQYPFRAEHAFWIGCGVLLWVIGLWLPRRKTTVKRVIGKAVCLVVSIVWMMFLLTNPLLENMGVENNAWNHNDRNNTSWAGVLTTLVREAQDLMQLKPEGYRAEELKKIDDRLLKEGFAASAEAKPNVIVIINESLTDYASLWEVDFNQDPLPNIHALQKEGVYGNLYVSSYGGETANVEHSFLTGTMPTPNVFMPLMTTIKGDTPTIAWQLKAQGYKTAAIHPEPKTNYQRNRFYPYLGMDQFFHYEDFKDAEKIHTYVSDRACYQKIISLFEEKQEDEKLFVYNLTMQNHGPYYNGQVEEAIRLQHDPADPLMEEYLNCIHESDKAFGELCSYFAQQEEPVVILIFGDHHPKVEVAAYEKREDLTATEAHFTDYITPFLIWSNQPMEHEYVEKISVNYLASLLLEKCGLPMTNYDLWNLEMAQKYPVVTRYGYADSNGQSQLWDDDSENWPVELQQLEYLRYNRLYDEANRLPALSIPK